MLWKMALNKFFIDRLNYSGDLAPLVERVCSAYDIGALKSFSVIETGYEDCNVLIGASGGKVVAKMFAKFRSREDILRYVGVMEKVLAAGVNHPPLLKTVRGEILYTDSKASGISMVLMKFIEGENFISLGRVPNEEELQNIIAQAAKINTIDFHPPYVFDSWAIPNIEATFDKVKCFIESRDLKLVEEAIARYSKIPVDTLPHCFVHGDILKTNVRLGKDGNIYILDFSVANWYPRIQELAVIASSLLFDEYNYVPLAKRVERAVEKYEKLIPLGAEEKKHLYSYALAGIAMEFLGACQEKYVNNNDGEETAFWLNLGREGLRKELGN